MKPTRIPDFRWRARPRAPARHRAEDQPGAAQSGAEAQPGAEARPGATARPHAAAQLGAAARDAARRAPQTLTVARRRAQPTAVTIARLTGTAIFAYLIALLIPTTTSRPVLAPLTALLVAQVSLYQTLRSAGTKVASVVAGVLLAVGLSAAVGFTWWSLGLTIAIGLGIGYALHLGENILEVPISAMLILSVGSGVAAAGRVEETFVGAGAGLLAGLVLATPKVQPAEEAIEDLCGKLAGLLDRITAGLREGPVEDSAHDWLRRARSVGGEIRRVDEALLEAEDSVRLNPRTLRLPLSTVSLRQGLEALEHEATAIRVLCRGLADFTRLAGEDNRLIDADIRDRLAAALAEISAALRVYGRLATERDAAHHERLEADLDRHLDLAHDHQDRLSELLRTDPAARPVGWPLRGELVAHLDRLRTELRAGKPEHRGGRRRRRWRVRDLPRRSSSARHQAAA
jgi:Aromatic acid exporter family member 1